MNLEQILRDAQRQRTSARALTERGAYPAARATLKSSIAEMENFLTAQGDGSADRIDLQARSELARELLDSYGCLGGVEWRAGELGSALRAYQHGRQIEEDDAFGIEDSYNLTNSIAVALLLKPGELGRMRDELHRAAQVVRGQVEGRRRDQWWAWADYGLLSLLLGDTETADVAYTRFEQCKPRLSDTLSAQRVLRALAEAVRTVHEDTAEQLDRKAEQVVRPG